MGQSLSQALSPRGRRRRGSHHTSSQRMQSLHLSTVTMWAADQPCLKDARAQQPPAL
ncbi:hypothetical protein DPMN_059109 [Dreissena polymorpha]|uniref:Uncharacterized protein n=1 Tax=Dreissena polymorpha TaxID=45954 RepID=A0A9D4HEL1_DREPO|nr:hypothetical protein DPMN_059109 [Dreissena polymorpha]